MTADEEKQVREDIKMRKWCWPDALIKSVHDPFSYALMLRTGHVLYFHYAEIVNNDWVRVHFGGGLAVERHNHKDWANVDSTLPLFDRGIEVRVSDIVWVADAPTER